MTRHPHAYIPVIATFPDGTETRYPSVMAAAEAIGVAQARISQACVLGHRCQGIYLRYENEYGRFAKKMR